MEAIRQPGCSETASWLGSVKPCRMTVIVERGHERYCWLHDPEGQEKRNAAYRKATVTRRSRAADEKLQRRASPGQNSLMKSWQVAEEFGVTITTIYDWVRRGRIKAYQAGGRGNYRFIREEVFWTAENGPPVAEWLEKAATLYSPPGFPPAVYFLCRDGVVVYVGKSENLPARIASHQSHRKIKFDKAFWINVPIEEVFMVESAFIRMLKPEYNRRMHKTDPTVFDAKITRRYMGTRDGND